MRYLADFNTNNSSNEDLRDLGRLGVTGATLGGGALLGAEIGTRAQLGRQSAELRNLQRQKRKNIGDVDKIDDSINELKANKQEVAQGAFIRGRNMNKIVSDNTPIFDRLLMGGRGKMIGAGIGAVAGLNAASSINNSLLPDDKYTDPRKISVAQERRKELSHRNRTSEEFRGWINTARRLTGG
jgi:gas vesicle protein